MSISSDSLDFKSCLDEPLPIITDSQSNLDDKLDDSPMTGDLKRVEDQLTHI